MSDLTFKIELNEVLDENLKLPSIDANFSGTVVLDFEKVKILSSSAIRNFVNWYPKNKQVSKISFENCYPVVVNQINFIEGFVPTHGVVSSFYVPYFCNLYEKKHFKKLTNGKHYDYEAKKLIDTQAKPPCKNEKCELELDANADRYFLFLS